jgi:hypothetical protein
MILSKTPARTRKRTVSDCYRQTKILLGSAAKDLRRSPPQHRTIRQQSRQSLASAYPPKRMANAPIQICWSGPTVPLPSQRRPESFPTRTALAESNESSTFAFAIRRHLADSDSVLKPIHDNGSLPTKTPPQSPKLTMPSPRSIAILFVITQSPVLPPQP